jgi:hypothetical protein
VISSFTNHFSSPSPRLNDFFSLSTQYQQSNSPSRQKKKKKKKKKKSNKKKKKKKEKKERGKRCNKQETYM